VSYTIRAHLGPLPGQIEDALLSVPGARFFRGAWQCPGTLWSLGWRSAGSTSFSRAWRPWRAY